jgi:uncharacterized Tic20 family protein
MQVQIASQDRNWAMAAHLSALIAVAGLPFGHIVGPLVVYLIKAHESEFVAEHARASLNYQITVSIVGFVGVIATVAVMLGYIASGSAQQMSETGAGLSLAVFWIAIVIAVLSILLISLFFIIAGTVAASQGRTYNYPFAIRFLR